MKIRYGVLALLMTNIVIAESPQSIITEREQVVRQYIFDLGHADYEGITALFADGGTVVSTSKGNVNAHDFFYGFLPHIEQASTEYHQGFISSEDKNRYAARFHFNFKLKDGEVGEGEYIDEFQFVENSSKLMLVYMFENLHF